MKKTEIATLVTALVTAQNEIYASHSEANKAHFDLFYGLVKGKRTRETAVAKMLEESKKITLDASKRQFVAMTKMAVTFTECNSVVNYSKVTWDNLQKVIKLQVKVKKNFKEDDVTAMQKDLGGIWEKGMSDFRYNNSLEVAIKTLNEKYTVIKEEEHSKIIERIYTDTNKLTVAEVTDLVKALLENTEVAEAVANAEKEAEALAVTEAEKEAEAVTNAEKAA